MSENSVGLVEGLKAIGIILVGILTGGLLLPVGMLGILLFNIRFVSPAYQLMVPLEIGIYVGAFFLWGNQPWEKKILSSLGYGGVFAFLFWLSIASSYPNWTFYPLLVGFMVFLLLVLWVRRRTFAGT